MSFTSPLAWYWVVAPLAVAALAAVLLLRAVFHVARGRFTHGGLHATTGLMLALVALCVGLIVLNTQSYARLTYERPVAEVTVAALHPALQTYRITVRRLDETRIVTTCDVQGDEWIMSAAVQKWRPWANILGLDSTYTLDQLANKYFSAQRGNGHLITACDLSGRAPSGFAPGLTFWLITKAQAQQRRFGSAVYMPLTDGAIYRVIMTQSGLNADAVNPIARAAVARRL
ncbi:MAG: hypothetical protein JWP16_1087 [Alphaproteobacteria bacterium]|jgi:hypothetical protein|nr:hypothetical protein [Alphaproteobacteria bacterium]